MTRKICFKHTEFENLKEIMYNSAEEFKDKFAYTIKNKNDGNITYTDITYKKLLEDINSLGTSFFEIGLKDDARVAVIGKNRYEWVLSHFANLLGNNVSIPLDKDLQLEELETSLIRSKARAIVFDIKLLDLIEEIKKRDKTEIKEYICMEKLEGYKDVPSLVLRGKALIEGGVKDYINTEIDKDKMSILLFTSGTTSESKAVMLSHKNVASNVYALQCSEDVQCTDTNIAFLPFHHIFGSTCTAIMLANGVRTVFPDGLKYIKQNMKEYGVSLFVGVPVLIEAMYKTVMKEVDKQGKTKVIKIATKISNLLLKLHIDIRRKLFKQIIDALGGNLRLIISGGAPADPIAMKGFNELGINVVQGYGLSETAPVIAAEGYDGVRTGSVGFPMINDIIEIENPDEKGIGEIKVKGPNIMLGYYEMPELTAEVIKDGWFYTGDLGYFDKDGYLFVTGRNKNLIVLKNGKKVFPEELETMVNRIDLFAESMVFGLPDKDDKNDYMVSVKVVLDKDVVKEKYSDKSKEELYNIAWEAIKEVNLTFPKYKHIKKLLVSDEELIKTTTKKVKRQEEMKLILNELEEK